MKFPSFAALLACLSLLIVATPARSQSCYGGQFQGLQTNFCGAQTAVSYATVQVPVAVAVQHVVQPVAIQQYAAPTCQAQSVAVQRYAVPSCQAQALAVQQYAVPQALAVRSYVVQSYGNSFGLTGNFRSNFVGATPVLGGAGVAANFVDRRGNQVQAIGNNRVDVRRGLLGNIKSVTVDQRPGLRLPF